MLDQPWHEVLFALYGLDDVERVDRLLADLEANDAAWDVHHAVAAAQGARTRHLEERRQRVLQQLEAGAMTAPGMPLEVLRQFPGMPDYPKPVS